MVCNGGYSLPAYQQNGIARLVQGSLLLADDVGLGKTSCDSLLGDMLLPGPTGPRHREWAVVIADEAQRLKNRGTEAALALKRLHARRAWALIGTPLENRNGRCWCCRCGPAAWG